MALEPKHANGSLGDGSRGDGPTARRRPPQAGPMFVLPAMLVLTLVLLFPLAYVVVTSFQAAGPSADCV